MVLNWVIATPCKSATLFYFSFYCCCIPTIFVCVFVFVKSTLVSGTLVRVTSRDRFRGRVKWRPSTVSRRH